MWQIINCLRHVWCKHAFTVSMYLLNPFIYFLHSLFNYACKKHVSTDAFWMYSDERIVFHKCCKNMASLLYVFSCELSSYFWSERSSDNVHTWTAFPQYGLSYGFRALTDVVRYSHIFYKQTGRDQFDLSLVLLIFLVKDPFQNRLFQFSPSLERLAAKYKKWRLTM
jgi:hypothetical protein